VSAATLRASRPVAALRLDRPYPSLSDAARGLAAVARGAAGGQGPAHRFEVGDATVTVSATPDGSVNLRIDR